MAESSWSGSVTGRHIRSYLEEGHRRTERSWLGMVAHTPDSLAVRTAAVRMATIVHMGPVGREGKARRCAGRGLSGRMGSNHHFGEESACCLRS